MKLPLVAIYEACQSLMVDHPEFWIISGLTDVSFETSTRNTRYQRSIATLREGPENCSPNLPQSLITELSRGVNSNVVEILRAQNPQYGPIKDDRSWNGIEPDIHWGSGAKETIVEIKALYECTLEKYYGPVRGREGSVAKDAEKLRKLRREEGFRGHLLQVVFFRQMPGYRYCSGSSWQGGWEHHECREYYLVRRDIQSQYAQVMHHLDEPAWPSSAPEIVSLALPSEIIHPIKRWLEMIFRPDDLSWMFDPVQQLMGAAVGCAIWQY
jgi:hypothetical protein